MSDFDVAHLKMFRLIIVGIKKKKLNYVPVLSCIMCDNLKKEKTQMIQNHLSVESSLYPSLKF